jgi:hypothetical protein
MAATGDISGHEADGQSGRKASDAATARSAFAQKAPLRPRPAVWRLAVTSTGVPENRSRASSWVEPATSRCICANGVAMGRGSESNFTPTILRRGMSTEERIERLRRLRDEHANAGSQRAIDKQHEAGKMTARGRSVRW